jgi:RNA polymerase sigma-70 factor (ECF subfamily)
MEPRSDAELLRVIPGDAAAVETLYRRYVDRVVSYAARRCAQPADVADLVAATFLAVIESAPKFDPARGDALPWIFGIAGRVYSNRLRRATRERKATGRLNGRALLDDDDTSQLLDRIEGARRTPEVEAAMAQLPPRLREVLWLVGYDGLDHAQAAQVVGLAAPAFRMRLSRARRALRKALGDDDPSDALPARTLHADNI